MRAQAAVAASSDLISSLAGLHARTRRGTRSGSRKPMAATRSCACTRWTASGARGQNAARVRRRRASGTAATRG